MGKSQFFTLPGTLPTAAGTVFADSVYQPRVWKQSERRPRSLTVRQQRRESLSSLVFIASSFCCRFSRSRSWCCVRNNNRELLGSRYR